MAKGFGWFLIAVIVIVLAAASWLPALSSIRSEVLSRQQEHFFAYFTAGVLLAGLANGTFTYIRAALFLVALAGTLEFGQLFAPGRNARFDDFLVSAMGAWVGVFAIQLLGFASETLPSSHARSLRGVVLAFTTLSAVATGLYLHVRTISSYSPGLEAAATEGSQVIQSPRHAAPLPVRTNSNIVTKPSSPRQVPSQEVVQRPVERRSAAQTALGSFGDPAGAMPLTQLNDGKNVGRPSAGEKTSDTAVHVLALTVSQERALTPGDAFSECDICPAMVVAPSGSFLMGSSSQQKRRETTEEPQHEVTFSRSFAVGKFAVTFAEWDVCVATGGCNGHRPADEGWGRDRQPVINVSWDDARAYIAWLSRITGKTYRLLSEAEREYVARAGSQSPFWWGSTISFLQANYNSSITFDGSPRGGNRRRTVPVDSLRPNPWGLYQVHGNVAEWVEDCWNETYEGAPADGSARTHGDCGRHVQRGGSWLAPPAELRAGSRSWGPTGGRRNISGLRVARTLGP